MKNLWMFLLFSISVCSCGESAQEKRLYTEEDIEGYWAVNSLIQKSEISDAIADNSGKSVQNNFLRFYNNVNGFSDTTYKISGDTIFMIQNDWFHNEHTFVPRYLIRFVSKDRIVLVEMGSTDELTYYSLLTIPASGDTCTSLKLISSQTGLWIRVANDSLTYCPSNRQKDLLTVHRFGPIEDQHVDINWWARLNSMYARLNTNDVLFARNKPLYHLRVDDDPIGVTPRTYDLEMIGSRGREFIGSAGYIDNAVVRALYWEISAAETHELRH